MANYAAENHSRKTDKSIFFNLTYSFDENVSRSWLGLNVLRSKSRRVLDLVKRVIGLSAEHFKRLIKTINVQSLLDTTQNVFFFIPGAQL